MTLLPLGLISELIQEVLIQRQGFDLVKRRSMMRIMARRMTAYFIGGRQITPEIRTLIDFLAQRFR